MTASIAPNDSLNPRRRRFLPVAVRFFAATFNRSRCKRPSKYRDHRRGADATMHVAADVALVKRRERILRMIRGHESGKPRCCAFFVSSVPIARFRFFLRPTHFEARLMRRAAPPFTTSTMPVCNCSMVSAKPRAFFSRAPEKR